MSQIQKAEVALLGINGAALQDYCTLFLIWKGYEFIQSTGSVIGKEKTKKGTPDAYFPNTNGRYSFVECTTKERIAASKGLLNKLNGDIDHCFDEDKSKINNDLIDEVILCFTDKLKPDEFDALRKKCSSFNASFKPYGIDDLAKAVLLYPSLGKLLGLTIDTNQILTPKQFISEYEHGKLATSLSNKIFFREDEIELAHEYLSNSEILILEGQAGVGKSRLALAILNSFTEKNPSFTNLCISNKNCPIYEDFNVYLDREKNYLILIDDVNRATDHFRALSHLLRDQRKGIIKIVLTVRNYAYDLVAGLSQDFASNTIQITKLSGSQIRELLSSTDFGITSSIFLDKIIQVSQGNPRLAIMAAKIALERNDLSAFSEVPKIYDSYYGGIVTEISEKNDPNLFNVLALIAFFRTVDKNYRKLDDVLNTFQISTENFWTSVITLHKLELVDLYQNDIVKTSDQILGLYFFYKIFIKDKTLEIATLLINYYHNNPTKFRDVIIPAVNTFGTQHVSEKISPAIQQVKEHFADNQDDLLELLHLFWFFEPDDTLLLIGRILSKLPINLISEYSFQYPDNHHEYSDNAIFKILKQYLRHPNETFSLALDLIFNLAEVEPSTVPYFASFISNDLIFKPDDRPSNFYIQNTFFEKLFLLIEIKHHPPLYEKLFLHITNTFLQYAFRYMSTSKRDNTFTISTYGLQLTSSVKHLRKSIWHRLFAFFEDRRSEVKEVVANYIGAHFLWGHKGDVHKKEIWAYDSEYIFPFIDESLDKNSFEDCKLVNDYCDNLTLMEISYNPEFRTTFVNKLFQLSRVLDQNLIYDKRKREYRESFEFQQQDGRSNWEKIKNLKYKQLQEYVQDFSTIDFEVLFRDYLFLIEQAKDRAVWSLSTSFEMILQHIATVRPVDCLDLLEYMAPSFDRAVHLFPECTFNLVGRILAAKENSFLEIYDRLKNIDPHNEYRFSLAFFFYLKDDLINDNHRRELLNLFRFGRGPINVNDFGFLSKFSPAYTIEGAITEFSKIFFKAICILVDRHEQEDFKVSFGWNFITKYNCHFKEDYTILKRVYLTNIKNDSHYDYEGKEFATLVNFCPELLTEFLQKFYQKDYSSEFVKLPFENFDLIWIHEHFTVLIDQLMTFAEKKPMILSNSKHFANKAFGSRDKGINQKQYAYILNYLENSNNDINKIMLAINVVSCSHRTNFIEAILHLLVKNEDDIWFKKIEFFQNGAWSGSRIPILRNEISFYDNLYQGIEGLPNAHQLLVHKLYLKEQIQYTERTIQDEMRREFIDPFGM